MVEHIRQWHQGVRLHLLHGDSKNSAADSHASPAELSEAEAREGRLALHDGVVVAANVNSLLLDLLHEVGALEGGQFLLGVVERKARVLLWQNLNILFEW